MSKKYPDISDPDFQEKINKIYKKYKIANLKPSFNSLCFPKEFTFQLPQLFVSKFISPDTPYKGLLIFHKIGAGKTCASILIALQWVEKRRVIFIVPASLIGNVYKECRSACTGNRYVSSKEREILNNTHPSEDKYKNLIEIINKRIDKDFEIYSFHKYISLYENDKINLNNALIIIDEVQNIVSENGIFYKTIKKSIDESSKSTRVVIMSGTPIFDKPSELALTINLLKPINNLPTGKQFNEMFLNYENDTYTIKNKDVLFNYLRGYISFSPGAPTIAFPKEIIKVIKCPMSDFQYNSYKMVVKREGHPDFKDILKLSNAFFIGSRMISNIAYPNKNICDEGINSLEGKRLHFTHISKYATKFDKIMTRIKAIKGPSIVYSNFREYGGIEPFIKMLYYNDYINVHDDGAAKKKYNRKRFAIWSGKENIDIKEMSKNIYNLAANHDGTLLKIMIISPSGKEGLSLFRTGSIHIMEPYFNWSRIAQIIGRGSRYCSHKDLIEEDRVVKIFLYLATSKNGKKTIDEYIYDIMKSKKRLLKEFYDIMEDVAVDKYLFENAKKFIKTD